jgi:hypothetical protein
VDGGAVFFLAIENCSFDVANYTLIAGEGIADVFPPIIFRAFFEKKDLRIIGFQIHRAKVFFDDQPQEAINGGFDGNFEVLIIKKAKKKIARHQSVRITTTDFGCSSPPFIFTRP